MNRRDDHKFPVKELEQKELTLLDCALGIIAFRGSLEISDKRDLVIKFVIFAGNEKRSQSNELKLLLVEGVLVHGDIEICDCNMDDKGALL